MDSHFLVSISEYKENCKLGILEGIDKTEQDLDSLDKKTADIECLIDFYKEFRDDLCGSHFDIMVAQLEGELKEYYKIKEYLEELLACYMNAKFELQQ